MTRAPRTARISFEQEDGTATELRLCFDANAMLLVEQLLGLEGLNQIGSKFDSEHPVSVGSIIKLVYAGAVRYQPDITEHEVGALIGSENMAEMMESAVGLIAGNGVDMEREAARDQGVRIAESPLSERTLTVLPSGLSPASTSDSATVSLEPRPSESLPS